VPCLGAGGRARRDSEIPKLQQVLGRKTLKNEMLKEAVEIASRKTSLRATRDTLMPDS